VPKIKKLLLCVAFFVGWFFFSGRVLAASYYVSTTGNDSSPGTIDLPFSTVQKAVSTVTPGDFIYLRSGTYNENVLISSSGSSGNLITLTSYSGESTTINGGSEIAIRTVSNKTIAYWVIDGITIRSTNRYTTRFGWWGENPVNNITVQNCTIYGANHIQGSYNTWEGNNINGTGYAGTDGDAGIGDAGDNAHHNTYTGNTIHDFTQYDSRGIWTQGNTHDSLIENNTVYNIGGNMGQCIDLDGAGNVEWRHTVRGNTVYGCGYVGIQLENVFASTLENNKVTGVFAGIIVINYDAGAGCGVGGESNQYGDTNADDDCRGADTDNIIRQNVIWTRSG